MKKLHNQVYKEVYHKLDCQFYDQLDCQLTTQLSDELTTQFFTEFFIELDFQIARRAFADLKCFNFIVNFL